MASAGEPQVWRALLDVGADRLAQFEATLSAAERDRADGLRGALARRRWVADHGWRRRLLAGQLECAAAEVDYVVAEQGKPAIAGSSLRFSASRSAGTALYVTCSDAEVGIDIEQIRRDVDVARMARRFFSAAERRAFEALAPIERSAGAFACWTRKEAHAKAVGTGLVFPLHDLDLWAGDDRPARRGAWSIRGLDAGSEFAAAVCVPATAAPAGPLRVTELS